MTTLKPLRKVAFLPLAASGVFGDPSPSSLTQISGSVFTQLVCAFQSFFPLTSPDAGFGGPNSIQSDLDVITPSEIQSPYEVTSACQDIALVPCYYKHLSDKMQLKRFVLVQPFTVGGNMAADCSPLTVRKHVPSDSLPSQSLLKTPTSFPNSKIS